MKTCPNCTDSSIICDFCKYSRMANETETDELLYCEFHNKGTDITDSCDEFWCICEGGEYEQK